MQAEISAYLTPVQIPAVERVAPPDSTSDTIYLMPEDCSAIPTEITVELLPADKNPVQCLYNPKINAGHVWYPTPDNSTPGPYLAVAAAVHIDLPQTPFWAGADFNPQLTAGDASTGPVPSAAPCPTSESDLLLIPADGWDMEIEPVPGEELRVTHQTYSHGSFAVSAYHSCFGLTGGWIVGRSPHPSVDEAYFYDVQAEGITHTNLIATDWEPRSVGDWCFLLRREGADDLTFPATSPQSPDSDILMLAPLTILGVG